VARLVPAHPPPEPRVAGTWENAIIMADDFDDELPEHWMAPLDP
jgi:antitoxin (DNA-binding transcriptional repressor) of toxin-antitoxin stability system